MSDAYFEPLGDGRYRPTVHVQGAWRDDEQHMAPVAGLLTHEIDLHEPRPGLATSRITFDILGVIGLQESQIAVRTLRPGRTIELVEATFSVAGRVAVRASAWRLGRQDTTSVAAAPIPPMPAPEATPPWDGVALWDGGYIASLELRRAPDGVPGDARSWLRTHVALVAGEQVSPTAAFLGLVDTANGVATRALPTQWMFPNVDLTVHLFRSPVGPWVGLDTRVSFGPDGRGLTSSWLHDELGPVGRAEQSLTLRPMPS